LKPGDIVHTKWHGHIIIACENDPIYGAVNDNGAFVSFGNEMEWTALPRQDQIQDIMLPHFSDRRNLLLNFGLWVHGKYSLEKKEQPIMRMQTGEQFWLSFWMFDDHDLMWTGEKWA
jgi:hypothetical protein